MKMNLKKLGEQAIESTTTTTKMRLSDNASSMVFQLFTKNVYSNPIGTVVREITSNCFDSHVEAGVNKPVIIRKSEDKETNTEYVSFIDFGVGMSPDRVENIYGVYFESTKRVDNTQIGGFGIGGKTPLAYKRSTGEGETEYDNSFYVITVFDGIKYYYVMSEGEDSPVINKLHEEATTEGNGTEVRIPVAKKDMNTFISEMKKQLYYFENVIFEGFEYKNEYDDEITYPLSNDYQIISGDNFLYRGNTYNNTMHVCLGRVAYPIDYSTLGLSSTDYYLPIALKLNVGDINVTVNREQLDYSEKTIKLLCNVLESAKAEILELVAKQYTNIVSLKDYFTVKHEFGILNFPNDITLNVNDIVDFKDVEFSNFKYSFTKMPTDKQLFGLFFNIRSMGKKVKVNRWSSESNTFEGGYKQLLKYNSVYHYNDEWKRKIVKQAWLKDQHTTYYLVDKKDITESYLRERICKTFNVDLEELTDDNGNPVKFVQDLIKMQNEYWGIVGEKTENYEDIDVPEWFVESRKRGAGITPELRKQTMPIRFVGSNRDRVKLSVLFDYNMPIFYGTSEDENMLSNYKRLYSTLFYASDIVNNHYEYASDDKLRTNNRDKNSIMFIQIAKGNVKHMQYCKKAYHISEFKWRMLYRKDDTVMKFYQTRDMIEKFNSLSDFYKKKGMIGKVSEIWGEKLNTVKTFMKTLPSSDETYNMRHANWELKQHFNVEDVKQTTEQKKVNTLVDELFKLQQDNETTLSYFNLPWQSRNFTDEQALIMSVSMAL